MLCKKMKTLFVENEMGEFYVHYEEERDEESARELLRRFLELVKSQALMLSSEGMKIRVFVNIVLTRKERADDSLRSATSLEEERLSHKVATEVEEDIRR